MDKILDRQIGVLRIVGVPDTAIYVDDALVGSIEPRCGLRAMLKAARRGDTIVLMGLEFLGRSTMETMTTIERLQEAGLHLWLLDVQIHTGTPKGQTLFEVVGLLGAAQRRRQVSWSKTVIMDSVAEGRLTLGKKPISREKLLEGGRLLLSGLTVQAVAEASGIGVTTVRKHRQTMLALARNDLDDLGPSDDR
jgi:DNA invertase Pin-like site-specific DNA recombinase